MERDQHSLKTQQMPIFSLLAIAFGLAMDAFAVSIGVSAVLRQVTSGQTFRLAMLFGVFQAMMPIIGWSAGLSVERFISAYDHWVAFGLLLFIGARMILSSFKGAHENSSAPFPQDPTRGITSIMLAIATSIDALAVGLSFALLNVSVWYPAVIIGMVAFLMTAIGMSIGARLGKKFGSRMELVGGLVLVGIGIKILSEHLLGKTF